MADAFRVTPIAGVTGRLVAHDWTWARKNAEGIARNWERRRARHEGIFDGPVLLACAHALQAGICRVDLFETTYAPFLAHRDGGTADGGVANAFAAIVPWTEDGAVLVGEMAAHTANAGQLYFPCGTPDRDDLRGDAVDLAGSAAREFTEETGLPVPAGAGEGWLMVEGEGQLAFLRPVRLPDSAAVLAARIEEHRSREAAPELAGIRILRRRADVDPARVAGFARAYLDGVLA